MENAGYQGEDGTPQEEKQETMWTMRDPRDKQFVTNLGDPDLDKPGAYNSNNNNGESAGLQRTVGFLGSVALIVGTIIGSGIFVSPGGILNNAVNVWVSLLVWVACGVLSMLGAIVYIELSTVVPVSGGEYSYLLAAFGPVAGYLNSWAAITQLRPSQLAVICLTCASNAVETFVDNCPANETYIKWATNILACSVVLLLTGINSFSVKFATRIQIIFTVAKLVGAVVIIGTGIYNLADGKTNNFSGGFTNTQSNFGKLASAFFSGLWAYDGWNQLNLVAEEIKDPHKNLPRAIFLGIPLVTVFYVLINVSFLTVIKPDEFGADFGSVAVRFGDAMYGPMSFIMPLCVVLSTFGAGNGVLFTSARITYVAGREGHLPDCISYADVDRDTPTISLVVNALITVLMILLLDVNGLIDFFSYCAWIFYGATAITHIVFRYTKPDAPRPFKAPVWMAVIVALMSGFLCVATVAFDPKWEYLYSVLFILAGLIFYVPCVHFKKSLPGMYAITKFLQLTFNSAPSADYISQKNK